MKILFLYFVISISFWASGQRGNTFFSFGLDYRQYPIDIEDVPRGPLPNDNGLPSDDERFWQTISIHGSYGLRFDKNWLFSTSLHCRYNLLHRSENVNYSSPYPTVLGPPSQKPKEKKNLKFDFFIDAEKKLSLKKNKERFLLIKAGVGFTNINTGFDIVLTDSVESIPFDTRHYQGTLLHFGPRFSFGYQYEKIKASIDTYIIEDPTLANLTSLWFGATLSYEFMLKKKKAAK